MPVDDGRKDAAAIIDTPSATDDGVDYAGTTVLATWGKEHVQLVRFMGMDIGPYAMDVVVESGETPIEAKRRAMVHLNEMAREEYEEKTPVFIERCREAEKNL